MAELKNSQRISYKATYNQVSPVPLPNGRQPLSRAVEKTAFVQSWKITPTELASLQLQIAEQARPGGGDEAGAAAGPDGVSEALAAIGTLIGDKTSTSTLNNAAKFATIDAATLVLIANALLKLRQAAAAAVNKSVADILSAYRQSLAPAAPAEPAPAPAAPGQEGAPAPAEGPTRSLTRTGIAVLTTLTPAPVRQEPGQQPSAPGQQPGPDLETRGYRASGAPDTGTPGPAGLTPALAPSGLADYAPGNAEALPWAEKNRPELFDGLVSQLQPFLGISPDERIAIGSSTVVRQALSATLAATLDENALQGMIAGFQAHMTIEPVGNLHLERIEMYPAGVERGELAHSVPMAPGETVNISHKEWSVTEKEFEDIVSDFFEGYSEQGVAEKTDVAMSTDSQSQHSTALNLGASLSASYASVTLSTSFGYTAATNDSQSKKDSRNHSMDITKKASARTKKEHKVTFKVTSVTGSEDQAVRVISNPSQTDSMRVDYFQLARKWKMDLLRYGLRMTYDIVIPNPGAGIFTLVREVMALDAEINTPFTFTLPLSGIYYNPFASDPQAISNYDQLAAQYNAAVTAPPEAFKYVNVHKETPRVSDYDHVHYDSIEFDIDDNYYIYSYTYELNWTSDQGETRDYITMLAGESVNAGLSNLVGESGHLSVDFVYQYVYMYAINVTFTCVPKVQVLLDWRLQVWNQIRQAALDQYNANIQTLKDQQAALVQQIADFDALTLRRMEQEEIMKGVLRWLLGPQFYLVPFNIATLFGPDASDPEVQDVLDPNSLTSAEWLAVMERGEFIKYIHNAIEWENVLYFTYPYFWDDNKLWDLKKFLFHPDPTHRTFLRSGAARVVLTIRPGFEPSFTSLVESGAFGGLPGPHPYVTIAQEIQDFANTNYPGFPPANPEQDARPLLYLEQRRVWREMQFIIQLLNAFKSATGAFPASDAANDVPAAGLTPYLDGPVVINGTNYNGINDYNTQANNQQLALDPNTPQEALLPTYAAVPVSDLVWGNSYFYQCPGDTGDYDLICYGADGAPGGTDKDADISANCEASLISTWNEYTPTSAMDIGLTMHAPNVVPAEPSTEIG